MREATNKLLIAAALWIVSTLPQLAVSADEHKIITFDELKFEMKGDRPFERSVLPEKVKALDGQRVTIKGYINPASVFELKGLEKFLLIGDNLRKSFGPGGPLYENIQVEMDSGLSADYTVRRITVEGVFSIRALEVEGKVVGIYRLQAVKVK